MDFEKQIIINALNSSKKEDYVVAYSNEELFDKDVEKSITARKSGNQWFAKKNHDEKLHEKIWKLYTRSIAFAPTESVELAAGFANRSAFLLHLKKYKEALLDVERALRITQSSVLKVKLFCRQAECFVALQEGKQSSSLEKAKYWLNKVENNGERANLNKMIEKAQKIIEENVLDCPEKEKKNDFICKNDAVDVCYEEKYGRGLIATRDIEPGELVYIEQIYVASVNKSKVHAYCSHCLAISWALIPCDHCAYYLYCSEKCKMKAWEKYHDIECCMKHINLYESFASYYAELSIRSLIIGIKEVGSIKKLRKMINEVEKCKDAKTKEYLKNGRFLSNSFKSLCSLQSSKNVKKIKAFSIVAVTVMQRLAKCTDIFGKDFHDKGESLEQHKDVVFIACLLLKLMSTFSLNAFSEQPMGEGCDITENIMECFGTFCCSRGMSLSLFTSLINHNCDNNVDKFYTNDGKVVYYATKPIKANSQIFSRYYFNYAAFGINIRRKLLLSMFDFRCDCLACREDWPNPKIIAENEGNIFNHSPKYNELTLSIIAKNRQLMINLNDNNHHFSRKEIQSLAKDIAKVHAQKTQKPNMATASFHFAFSAIMDTRYFDKLKVPSSCDNKQKIEKENNEHDKRAFGRFIFSKNENY